MQNTILIDFQYQLFRCKEVRLIARETWTYQAWTSSQPSLSCTSTENRWSPVFVTSTPLSVTHPAGVALPIIYTVSVSQGVAAGVGAASAVKLLNLYSMVRKVEDNLVSTCLSLLSTYCQHHLLFIPFFATPSWFTSQLGSGAWIRFDQAGRSELLVTSLNSPTFRCPS